MAKSLKGLSTKDLKNRARAKTQKIQRLENQLSNSSTKKERAAIQSKITKAENRKATIREKIVKRQEPGSALPSRKDMMQELFNSDEFQMLSPANQQVVQQSINAYSIEDLQKFKISKKQAALIAKEVKNEVRKKYRKDKGEFDQDQEQVRRTEVAKLEALLQQQKEYLNADLSNGNIMSADERKIAVRNLQDALSEAKDRYSIEAERKNTYLQNELKRIQEDLDTTTGRVSEDKIIQLKQLEKNYTRELRDTQENMAMRGLAISGIRARAEDELAEDFNDNRTTAEIEAERRMEDARRQAERTTYDVTTITQDEIDDLLYTYGVRQREGVQGAETILGSPATQRAIGGTKYAIGGVNPETYMYGGLLGSSSLEADKLRADARKRDYRSNIDPALRSFESAYGTKQLNQEFGGRMDGYKRVGDLRGTENVQAERVHKALKEQRAENKDLLIDERRSQIIESKI